MVSVTSVNSAVGRGRVPLTCLMRLRKCLIVAPVVGRVAVLAMGTFRGSTGCGGGKVRAWWLAWLVGLWSGLWSSEHAFGGGDAECSYGSDWSYSGGSDAGADCCASVASVSE